MGKILGWTKEPIRSNYAMPREITQAVYATIMADRE
jgi:hypothetical protein